MAMSYYSLRGKLHLALLIAGVPSELRYVGNTPELSVAMSATTIDHRESNTGMDTIDASLFRIDEVTFDGILEEIGKENIAYILSGTNHDVESETVASKSLGVVTVGQKIRLGGYNLTNVSFTDSTPDLPVTIDPSKYTVDPVFGTVVFHDLNGVTTPVLANYKTGAVTHTTIASDFNKEYQLYFEGENIVNGQNVALTLHKTKKSPEAEFGLIHEEYGQYSISGKALSDSTKDKDGAFGLYGYYVEIPVVPSP